MTPVVIAMYAGGVAFWALIGALTAAQYSHEHSNKRIVTIGGAAFSVLIYVLVLLPMMLSEAELLAALPGAAALFILWRTRWLYRTPLIGRALLVHSLAVERWAARKAVRRIRRLEALENSDQSNKQPVNAS